MQIQKQNKHNKTNGYKTVYLIMIHFETRQYTKLVTHFNTAAGNTFSICI